MSVVKAKKWQRAAGKCKLMFLPHFDVLRVLLLNSPTATGNLFVKVPSAIFRHCFFLFFFILLEYSFLGKFFNVISCSKQIINYGQNILQNRESLVAMTYTVMAKNSFHSHLMNMSEYFKLPDFNPDFRWEKCFSKTADKQSQANDRNRQIQTNYEG